jgi:predicted metal-dependent hydrolase
MSNNAITLDNLNPEQTISQTPFDIPVRRDLEWDFSQVERQFVEGDIFLSYLYAAFSCGATPIESFFIKSLKPTLDSIVGDDKLKRDVDAMIKQEALHSSTHRKFNNRLKELGYDIDGATQYFDKKLKQMVAGFTPIDQLGFVSAAEHGLYSFAMILLNDRAMQEQIHPQARRLFVWHFMEEAEHGAVSHDQYRYFMGNAYSHRMKTALRASQHVFNLVDGALDIFAQGFGHSRSVKNRIALLKYQWATPGIYRQMAVRMADYMSPSYELTFGHENTSLIQKYEQEIYAPQKALV